MDEEDAAPPSNPSVPANAELLLSLFLAKTDRLVIRDDLEEEFRTQILPRLGAKRARRWYWRQATRTILYRNPVSLWLLTGGKMGARATENGALTGRSEQLKAKIARLESEYNTARAELVA